MRCVGLRRASGSRVKILVYNFQPKWTRWHHVLVNAKPVQELEYIHLPGALFRAGSYDVL